MITTAVQQASQMVEIQGAPAAAQTSGDEFRVTFAASLGEAAAQKTAQSGGQRVGDAAPASAGASSIEEALAAGLLVMKASNSASGVTQSLRSLKGIGSNEDTSEVETKSNLALVLKNTATTSTDTSVAKVDSRSVVLTRMNDEEPLQLAAATAPLPVAVKGPVVSATAPKRDVLSKPADSEVSARSRKTEASDTSKDLSDAKAQETVPCGAIANGVLTAAAAISQAQPVPTTLGGSIAVKGSKAGVLTSVVQASDGTKMGSGSPTRSIDTNDLIPASAGQNGVVSLQRDAFAIAGATADAKGTGDSTPVAKRGNPARDGVESTAKSDLIVAGSQSSKEDGSETTKALAGSGVTATAVPTSLGMSLSRATQRQHDAGLNKTEVKTNASSESQGSAAVPQTRAIAALPSGWIAQPLGASQAALSKIVSAAQDSPANFAGKDSGRAPRLDGTSEAPTNNVSAPAPIGAKIPPQLEAVRDTALASTPVREAASKVGLPATKDDKTKVVLGGSEDTTATQASALQGAVPERSGGSASSTVTLANNVTIRAITAADAVVYELPAMPHAVGSPTHTATAVSDSTPALSLNAVSAASLPDPSPSVAQVGESHRTLLATPTTLEVGVQSGTQGWLRIRAEVGDQGAVNASLAAGSSGGRELLHSQMPALNAFLHSEQMAVTTTVVDRGAFAGGNQASAALGSGGLGSQDGAGGSNGSLLHEGGAQSDSSQRGPAHHAMTTSSNVPSGSYDALITVNDTETSLSGRTTISGESGRWLNVRV